MQILVYSETTASTVAGNLGRPEYSYFFILDKYLPLLRKIGEVVFVEDPARDVDRLYDQALKAGDSAVFLSFTPPHCTPKQLRCPTVSVLAWEFDSIPDDDWDPEEPWHNWVAAICAIGNVVTISDYATRVIRQQVGPGPYVVTIPAPVVHEASARAQTGDATGSKNLSAGPDGGVAAAAAERELRLMAAVIDSQALDISTESVTPRMYSGEAMEYQQAAWSGHEVDWRFSSVAENSGQYLVGFYGEEDWGSWSKTAKPSIIFPWSISGEIELSLELAGYGENRGRTIQVLIGGESADVELQPKLHTHVLRFTLPRRANSIQFTGLSAMPAPGARDHRTLGVGLSRMVLRRPAGIEPEPGDGQGASDDIAPQMSSLLRFSGPVYTSVFNPADGRKNWHDIVTAFCWAFRDQADKTLLLKMSHHNRSTFLGELLLLFSRLAPFECRIVAIHGYLSVEELQGLVETTDFFVNASLAEGQCLPLLEFMAAGVPAISPDHTAMETYINTDNAFVVASSEQPHKWPNDPRRAFRTVSNRIDWDSLRRAYLQSAAVLSSDAGRYEQMSASASATVREHYSDETVEALLRQVLEKTARRKSWFARMLAKVRGDAQ